MRKLTFELVTPSSAKRIWPIMSDINNYHKYIKYCHHSKLVGSFKEGSTWYDWSTVAFLPLKINHEIIKIIPNKKIVYLIKSPFGEIWQTISIKERRETRVKLEIVIDSPNRLVENTIGLLVYKRNKQMLEETIKIIKMVFK